MAINTYFKNIADAIREKTGGSAFITPGQMPQAILNIPVGGDVDLHNINVFGMFVDATRGNTFTNFVIQIGAFFVENANGNEYVWGKCSAGAWGGLVNNSSETAVRLFRNNHSGMYKLLVRKDSNTSYANPLPAGFLSFHENTVDCTIYNKWKWYTANDGEERDPITFGLLIGNYNNGELKIKMVDYGTHSITTNRNSLAYTGDIT